VDDASDDAGDLTIAGALGSEDRITVIRLKDRGGSNGARQAGFELGSAEWIAIRDSDDLWAPDKLERPGGGEEVLSRLADYKARPKHRPSDLAWLPAVAGVRQVQCGNVAPGVWYLVGAAVAAGPTLGPRLMLQVRWTVVVA
jgi:glycosyltransferase involved in cell wall biosynthesis